MFTLTNLALLILYIGLGAALFELYHRGKEISRLREKLEGKADRKKGGPRPGLKRVDARPVVDRKQVGDDISEAIVGWECSVCDSPVPKGGHTVKMCEAIQCAVTVEQALESKAKREADPLAQEFSDPSPEPPMEEPTPSEDQEPEQ